MLEENYYSCKNTSKLTICSGTFGFTRPLHVQGPASQRQPAPPPTRTRPLWTHFTTTLSKTEGNWIYSDREEGKKKKRERKLEEGGTDGGGGAFVTVLEIKKKKKRNFLSKRWRLEKEGQADTG